MAILFQGAKGRGGGRGGTAQRAGSTRRSANRLGNGRTLIGQAFARTGRRGRGANTPMIAGQRAQRTARQAALAERR